GWVNQKDGIFFPNGRIHSVSIFKKLFYKHCSSYPIRTGLARRGLPSGGPDGRIDSKRWGQMTNPTVMKRRKFANRPAEPAF
ncbi:MAG: hypothetical protein AABZ40_03335, partial [Thermodesulfobacteriota bacterium]